MNTPWNLFALHVIARGLAAGVMLLAPGLIWVWRFPLPAEDTLSRLGRAIAFALAWNTLLAELLAFFPLSINVFHALTLAVLALTVALRPPFPHRPAGRFGMSMTAVAALLGWRLFQVRGVLLPPWVDPVHHTLLVRLFLENARVPLNLQPVLDIPFYYHFGFHLNAAWLGWLARLSPVQATFLAGTWMNAAVPIGLYALARAIWPGNRRAWTALWLSGLVMHMPAYYATWGRYTLLTGLMVSTGLLALAARSRHQGVPPAEFVVLTGGLVLAHYFAALLTALALGCLLLSDLLRRRATAWLPSLGGMTLGVGLALPWLGRVLHYAQPYSGIALPRGQSTDFARQPAYLWQLLSPKGDHLLYVLALGAAFWALSRQRSRPWALWGLLLAGLSLPWSPALRPFRPDHFVIVLFSPAALLLADLGDFAARFPLHHWRHPLRQAALAGLALILTAYGLHAGGHIVNPATVFVQADDLAALHWADDHLPPDARVLLNAVPWQGGAYRGADGGWWLLPLTGRSTFPPPVLFTFGTPKQAQRITQDATTLSRLTTCDATFWSLVERYRITHLYLHRRVGPLQPNALSACPGLQVVYQDGVTIFAVTP